MASRKETNRMYICQQTKDSVKNMMDRYLSFVTLCLYNDRYTETMNNLLPFDNFARAKLKQNQKVSKVKSLGMSVMRMDFEPTIFSLGISIEIEEGKYNRGNDTTILVTACRTLEQLRQYVRTEDFEKVVRGNFDKQIDISFSQRLEEHC